jgi:hypothetical protein
MGHALREPVNFCSFLTFVNPTSAPSVHSEITRVKDHKKTEKALRQISRRHTLPGTHACTHARTNAGSIAASASQSYSHIVEDRI